MGVSLYVLKSREKQKKRDRNHQVERERQNRALSKKREREKKRRLQKRKLSTTMFDLAKIKLILNYISHSRSYAIIDIDQMCVCRV
jgi:hypothetical protein